MDNSFQARTLLISEASDNSEQRLLRQLIAGSGQVDCANPEEAFMVLGSRNYDLIILETPTREALAPLIGRLRERWPAATISILTISPTWKRAREAFMAGASDYLVKSLATLPGQLRAALQRMQPRERNTGKGD